MSARDDVVTHLQTKPPLSAFSSRNDIAANKGRISRYPTLQEINPHLFNFLKIHKFVTLTAGTRLLINGQRRLINAPLCVVNWMRVSSKDRIVYSLII